MYKRENLMVNWRSSFSLVGSVVKWLSVPLLFPFFIGVYYGDDAWVFASVALFSFILGYAVERIDPEPDIQHREAFLMVALSWLVVSIIGAAPYVLAGSGSIGYPVNALFESMSGFTTTGATVMDNISIDSHSHAVMMWRQMTQWLGGMGIIVLGVAILSSLSVGGAQIMEAETPGEGITKLTSNIAETARILWGLYFALTAFLVVLFYALHLSGLAPNMDLYTAIAHAFTTMPTGGFSTEARSIEAFSPAIQWVITLFMFIAGTSFVLIWMVMSKRDYLEVARNTEFRFYLGSISALSLIGVVLLISGHGVVSGGFRNLEPAIRESTFQFVSIITTTGYASVDFNEWGSSVQLLLFLSMFLGGMVGSTGGGIKILRWVIIQRAFSRDLSKLIHPDMVQPIRLGEEIIYDDTIRSVFGFVVLYLLIWGVGALLIMEDSTRGGFILTNFEALSTSAALIGNIGPAFGVTGPMNSYLGFTDPTKIFMVVMMWMGRLELYPILILFTKKYWFK